MKFSNELKIGTFVVVVGIILAMISLKACDYDFRPENYNLKILFKSIDGVSLNAPVTINGFEVGRVQDIQIKYEPEMFVELTVLLEAKAKVREGAKAYVKNMGFMGEKYVGLTMGEEGKPFLADGAVIKGVEPGSFESIMSKGEVIAQNLEEISTNINERLKVNADSIDAIVADLRLSMNNIAGISGNVNERLEVNKMALDQIIAHINAASSNLDDMSYDLKINPWKLLYKDPKKRPVDLDKK